MIHKAKDLSPEQKIVVESLLGRPSLNTRLSVSARSPLLLPRSGFKSLGRVRSA